MGVKLQKAVAIVEASLVEEKNIGCILSEFQWNQPINVYGVTPSRYEFINSCEVHELEILLSCIPASWWESIAIELSNKPGRMIPVVEVLPLLGQLLESRPTQLTGFSKMHYVFWD